MWTAFLEDATRGDKELIDYLQRMAGYCLTGDTREDCLFLLYGTGANGKSGGNGTGGSGPDGDAPPPSGPAGSGGGPA